MNSTVNNEVTNVAKDDKVAISRSGIRHSLKGSIRSLRFIIDEIEQSEEREVPLGVSAKEKYIKDFEINFKKIKDEWECYKVFLQ